MKMHPLALIALLSFSSSAQDIKPLTQILQQGVNLNPFECTPEMDQLAQDCIKKICGEPGSFPLAYTTGNELNDFRPDAAEKQEIERSYHLMETKTKEWKELVGEDLNGLIEYFDLNPGNIHPAQIDVSIKLNRYVSYQVDGDKIKIIPRFPQSFNEKLRAGIEEWSKNKEAEAQKDPWLRARLGLSSPEESFTQLKMKYQSLSSEALKIPAQDPRRAELDKLRSNLDKFLQNSQTDLGSLEKLYFELKRFAFNLTTPDPYTEPREHPIETACKEKCLEGLKLFFTGRRFQALARETLAKLAERENYLKSCKAGLELQAMYGTLPGQKEKSQKIFNGSLEKFLNQKWLSQHTKKAFEQFIKKGIETAHRLDTKKNITEENLDKAIKYQQTLFSKQRVLDTLLELEDFPGNIFHKALPFCISSRTLVNDSFRFGSSDRPLLTISPFACAHEGKGESIVAHELGHAFSYFLSTQGRGSPESQKRFLEIRSCINSQNKSREIVVDAAAYLPFPSDTMTTEEDMADWLSANSVPAQTPTSCAFMYSENGKYSSDQFDLRRFQNYSSDFMRLIRHHHVQKKTLPSSCSQYLEIFQDYVGVKECK